MTGREPWTIRIDPDVRSDFIDQVIEWEGQKRGELGRHVENALREYTDNDRGARIERKVDVLLDRTAAAHTHTKNETKEKVELIAERIGAGDRIVVPEDDVQRAIEDIAGGDPRTVEKYEQQLRRRGLAYEHPSDSAWALDREQWITWAEAYINNNPTAAVADVIGPYPLDFEQYDRAVTEVDPEA